MRCKYSKVYWGPLLSLRLLIIFQSINNWGTDFKGWYKYLKAWFLRSDWPYLFLPPPTYKFPFSLWAEPCPSDTLTVLSCTIGLHWQPLFLSEHVFKTIVKFLWSTECSCQVVLRLGYLFHKQNQHILDTLKKNLSDISSLHFKNLNTQRSLSNSLAVKELK